jgi:hypothetical protein
MAGPGGRRPGAGRKPRSQAPPVTGRFSSGLEFCMRVVNDEAQPVEIRLRAAASVLPYQEKKIEPLGKKALAQAAAESIPSEWGDVFLPGPAPGKVTSSS